MTSKGLGRYSGQVAPERSDPDLVCTDDDDDDDECDMTFYMYV